MSKKISSTRLVVTRWIASAATAVAVGVSGWLLILIVWIPIANSDFQARTRSLIVLDPQGNSEFSASLILHRLIPEENAAEASLAIRVFPGPILDSIRAGTFKARVTVWNRSSEYPIYTLESLRVDTAASASWELSMGSERFSLPLHSSVTDFPWDYYVGFIGIRVQRDEVGLIPARFSIAKGFPGWRVVSEGNPMNLTLRFERPLVQRLIVLLSLVVFVLLSLWVVFSILQGPKELSAISGSTALAGFVLAAAGYREIVGLSSLPSVSWLDLIVLGVPLIALLIGIPGYVRRHYSRESEAP